MMQNKMRNAVKLANNNLQRVYDWLEENDVVEKLSKSIDLKLYDVAYYTYDFPDNKKQYWYNKYEFKLFERFCDDESQHLRDWCFENFNQDFGDMIKYIRFSSSFYFNTGLWGYKNGCNLTKKRFVIYDEVNSAVDIVGEEGYISLRSIKDDIPWYIKGGYGISYIYDYLEWLSNPELLKDIKNKYEDYIKLHDHIAEFKAHQVEIFKKYIDDEYEWYLEMLEDDIA